MRVNFRRDEKTETKICFEMKLMRKQNSHATCSFCGATLKMTSHRNHGCVKWNTSFSKIEMADAWNVIELWLRSMYNCILYTSRQRPTCLLAFIWHECVSARVCASYACMGCSVPSEYQVLISVVAFTFTKYFDICLFIMFRMHRKPSNRHYLIEILPK